MRLLTLGPVASYSKRRKHEAYQFHDVNNGQASDVAALESHVNEWNEMLRRKSLKYLLICEKDRDSAFAWLMFIRSTGTDRGDRVTWFANVARFSLENVKPELLPNCLWQFRKACQEASKGQEQTKTPTEIPITHSVSDCTHISESIQAAIAIAIGHQHAVVSDMESAAGVLTLLTFDPLEWIALVPGGYDNPPDGKGLIFGDDSHTHKAPIPPCAKDVWSKLGEIDAALLKGIDLCELAHVNEPPPVKLDMFKTSVHWSGVKLPDQMSSEALGWLVGQVPEGRFHALRIVRSEQLLELLEGVQNITPEEFRLLKDRVNQLSDGGRIVRYIERWLGRGKVAVEVGRCLLPDHGEELIQSLFPESMQDMWCTIRDNTRRLSDADEPLVTMLFEWLRDWSGLDGLKVESFATAAQSKSVRAMDRFAKVLTMWMPDQLVWTLLGREAPESVAFPKKDPPLEENRWIHGVDPESLVKAGFTIMGWGDKWRKWWRSCVEILCKKQILPRRKVLETAVQMNDLELLRKTMAPAALLALFEDHAPIEIPPEHWDETADEAMTTMLGRLFDDGVLFRRIRRIQIEGWEWLANHLPPGPRKSLQSAFDVMKKKDALDPEWIDKIGHLVGPKRQLQQIVNWAHSPSSDARTGTLQRLIGMFKDDRHKWLYARLIESAPVNGNLPWSASELMILWPLLALDPFWQLVIEVLHRPAVAAEKEQETKLLADLREVLKGKPSPPLPPRDVRERRPEWIRALWSPEVTDVVSEWEVSKTA